MKALLIYSSLTGRGNYLKHIPYIGTFLYKKFDCVDLVKTENDLEFKEAVNKACNEYDYLIFLGGDGTVNKVLNFIGDREKKPILGYIPCGTTNDFAKTFKLKKNLKKSLKNILDGTPKKIDVCKINDRYFGYFLATGAYSEISYTAKRKNKKIFGSFSYYFMAIKDAFKKKEINGILEVNNQTYEIKTPFLLVLNGKYAGGFKVDRKNKYDDHKFTIFITKPGLFNGLLHYLFKFKLKRIECDSFSFKFNDEKSPWCIDGEKIEFDSANVTLQSEFISLIIPNNSSF